MDLGLTAQDDTIVSVKRVCYGYRSDSLILSDVSFDVARGECLGLLGVSGVGKTTLLRLLSGELIPTKGTISRARLHSAVVSQGYTLLPHLSARANVELVLRRREHFPHRLRSNCTARIRANELLASVGMAQHANARPAQLSGGQRQRIAIAQAIAQDANLLLMDEPFGALDVQTRDQLQQLLIEATNKNEFGVVLVTHDLEEALYVCNRILLLQSNVTAGASIEELRLLGTASRVPELKATDAFLKQLAILRYHVTRARSNIANASLSTLLDRGLVAEADLGRIEAIADIVAVISRDLYQEQANPTLKAVVEATWNSGKRYTYILPETAHDALAYLETAARDSRRRIEIVVLPSSDALFLLGEIVLYALPNDSVAAYTYGGDIGATTLFRLPEAVAGRLASRFLT